MFDLPTPEEQRKKLASLAPNGSRYDGSAEYLRHLLAIAGLSQNEAANLLKIKARTFREHCSLTTRRPYPYILQYALEGLAYGDKKWN